MIESFKDKETKLIYEGKFSKKLPYSIQKIALRKLIMLNCSESINDLRMPPSNHLERLCGDLKDFWSIRVNDQYRIIFRIDGSNYFEVQIIDYH